VGRGSNTLWRGRACVPVGIGCGHVASALVEDITHWRERPSVGSPQWCGGNGRLGDRHRGRCCDACKELAQRMQGASILGGSGLATSMGTKGKKGGVAAVTAVERLLIR
jgi:hypothetical protein